MFYSVSLDNISTCGKIGYAALSVLSLTLLVSGILHYSEMNHAGAICMAVLPPVLIFTAMLYTATKKYYLHNNERIYYDHYIRLLKTSGEIIEFRDRNGNAFHFFSDGKIIVQKQLEQGIAFDPDSDSDSEENEYGTD